MTANVFINGPIGFPPGEVAGEVGTTLMDLRRQVDSFGGGIEKLNVYINSPGGDVAEGFAIYDYLKTLGYPVTTIGEGKVYSIASVIFSAGSERLMQANAELFLHDPLTGLFGNARDMRDAAQFLDVARDKIINTYLSVATDSNREDMISMMETETFLNAEDSVKLGFATGIYAPKGEPVAWYQSFNNSQEMDDVTRKGILAEIREAINGAFKTVKNEAPEVVEPEAPETPEELETLKAENETLKNELQTLKAEKEAASAEVSDLQAVNFQHSEALKLINAKLEALENSPAVSAPPRSNVETPQKGVSIPQELQDKFEKIVFNLKKFQ